MSEDPFQHPDFQDRAWARRLKKAKRRDFWRRVRSRLHVVVTVVAAVAVAAFIAYRETRPAEAPPVASAPATATTTPTSMQAYAKVDVTQPFVATPAAGWADGEAGLVVPAGTAINGFTAAKVDMALAKAKEAVVVSRLDRRVIQDNNVDVFAALFAKDGQQYVRADPPYYTKIAPGYKLSPVTPKVSGKFTVEAGAKGELVMRVSYAVAYAFHTDEPDKLVNEMDIVTLIRVQDQKFVLREGPSFDASSHGLWPDGIESWHMYSISCKAAKENMLAPAYSDRYLGTGPMPDEQQVFDVSKPMPVAQTC